MQEEEQFDEQQEVDYKPYVDIEALQDFYPQAGDLKKLKDAGFCTIASLLMNTKKQLCEVKGFNEQKRDALLKAVQQYDKAHGGTSLSFSSGIQVRQHRQHVLKITTGSSALDALLGGGIESQSITEAYGEFRCGKTQLSHTLAVTCQKSKEEGGGEGQVLYLDTEGTFRPERIIEISQRFGMDGEEALGNIKHARAFSVEHLIDLLQIAQKTLVEDGPFSLLIVDSIMALFRVDYSGRGELSERQQVLGKVMSTLMKMAEQFNIAIFITNQVQSDPSGMAMGDNKKPIGGNVLAHASTSRLYLKKGSKEERTAVLVDSPSMKEDSVKYKIAEGGIMDI